MTISVCDGRLIKMTVATALLATVAQPGFGQDLKYKPISREDARRSDHLRAGMG